MKKTIIYSLLGILAVVVVVVLTSPRVHLFGSGAAASGGPSVSADPRLPVSAVVLAPELLANRILSTGTVLANEEVELRSEIAGKIEKINFGEGRSVRKGDVLATIDDSELQAQLLKLTSQQRLAADKEMRRKELLSKQLISSEDYETALNELNSIRAEIKLTEARIAKTKIKAPFDGIVGLRYVSEGSYVSPDSRIASLQSVEQVKVDFAVPEKYAGEVRTGQEVRFRTAHASEYHRGRIYAVEPKIDPATRTVQLRALSPNPEGKILPGSFAEVELILQEYRDALLIPTEALVPELQGQKVFVSSGGRAVGRSISIGLRTEKRIQVVAGLAPRETLITTGLLQLVDGMPVNVTSTSQP